MSPQRGVSQLLTATQPRSPVTPGQYLVTMTALCEVEPTGAQAAPVSNPPAPPLADQVVIQPTPDLLATEPIQALIVVPKIRVRIIPRMR
jgi:hypothetical protein